MVGPRKIASARRLRRRSTDAERRRWARLRNRQLDGLKFKRQVAIDRFVVDFSCLERHLVVELDGGQHGFYRAAPRDADRTGVLEAMGYVVMRFGNGDVLADPDSVMMTILDQVHRLDQSTGPLPFPQEAQKRVPE